MSMTKSMHISWGRFKVSVFTGTVSVKIDKIDMGGCILSHL